MTEPLSTTVVAQPPAGRAPGAPPPASDGGKVKVGCLVAIVVVFLLFVGLAGAGAWFAIAPGKAPDVDAFVGPESVALMRVELDPNDKAAHQLVEELLALAESAGAAHGGQRDVPPMLESLGKLQDFNRANQVRELKKFVPREVLVIVEPENDAEVAVVAKFDRLPRWLRGLMVSALGHRAKASYAGHEYVALGGDGYVTFIDATAVYAGDLRVFQRLIDRYEARGREARPPLWTRLQGLGPGYVGQAAARMDSPTLSSAFGDLGDCNALTSTLALLGPDAVELRVTLECGGEATASAAADILAEKAGQFASDLRERGFRARVERVANTGARADATLRITALKESLRSILELGARVAERDGASPPEPARAEEGEDTEAPSPTP